MLQPAVFSKSQNESIPVQRFFPFYTVTETQISEFVQLKVRLNFMNADAG